MHRTLISLAVALLCAASLQASSLAANGPDKATGVVALTTTQLPRTIRPNHYDVLLTPDAGSMRFSGQVTISLTVLEPTDSITLHAMELEFNSVSLQPSASRAQFGTPKISIDAAAQTATFTFSKPLAKGNYRLTMDYHGKIGTQASGLFAVDYQIGDDKKRAIYTQFENSDARRMIPSWDEPGFRTSFTLAANIPSGEMAVSNMPITRTRELGKGRSLVRFATTPKMSTYLLFFGLGEFERAAMQQDGIDVGVITKKGALSQANFALRSSVAVLKEYNDYFGVRYPLPKLDNIAAPGRSQFFGAMENWGAIFTFEYALLQDPAISTKADQQNVFAIAAHEIAHQWFGDLVTMRWWDDLWLNEGFATWMEGRTTELLHPEWNTALSAVTSREAAMGRDALVTTHPVVQHVETVEQASQAFDDITYQKGAAVIGMLENYVGAESWRKGVRAYFKQHAYGNTVTDDFWQQIELASGKPIKSIAHDFTLQAGVPLLRVAAPVCQNGVTTLSLSQGEFSKDHPEKIALRWQVPVVAQALGAKTLIKTLVRDGAATLTVPGCAPVLLNAGQRGYYRTMYTAPHFAAIAQQFSDLAPLDQLGLMSDSWSLSLAGYQSPEGFLALAKATPLSADPQVWGKIAAVFGTLDAWYAMDKSSDPARVARFRSFAIARLAPLFAQVGWVAREGEADTVSILRNTLISTLGSLGDPAMIAEARRRYAASASDATALPGNLRRAAMTVVARHVDEAGWTQLRAAAAAEKSALVRDKLYDLLAMARDPQLARRALDLALTTEPGETSSAAMLTLVSLTHPDMAYDFALANMERVNGKIDSASRSRYYPSLASGSADPAMIDKINAYAATYLAASARRDADTAVASIRYRIKVLRETLPQVDAWLGLQ